jgi:hypothetical protein
MRLLTASLRKLVARPASRRTTLVVLALLAFILAGSGAQAGTIADPAGREGFVALFSFPGAYANLSGMLVVLLGIAGAAWAGAVAGGEWSWNTFRLALARGESRVRYVLVTFAAIAGLLLAVSVILFALGVPMFLAGAAMAGIAAGDPADPAAIGRLPLILATSWWAIVLWAGLSFAVAFIARSQVAGIAGVVGLYFVEQSAGLFLPKDIVRLAPMTASSELASQASQFATDPNVVLPLALTTLYIVLAGAALAVVADRTEVA